MIFHVDMDAFFAAIEVVLDPSLRGKPVIIGGNPERRGVVSTCSYEARKFGVHSAMPAAEARRLCPEGIFLRGSYERYGDISRQIMALLRSFTPYVQVMSVDEAYLNVDHLLDEGRTPEELATIIQNGILAETGLTCSIGMARSKMLAKIGSGHNKPAGQCLILPENEISFLHPLPIGVIPGIGKRAVAYLTEGGVTTVGDLQKYSLQELLQKFGGWGEDLYSLSRGGDSRPVRWIPRLPKSIGEERTFSEDTNDTPFLLEALEQLISEATERLIRKGMRAKGITLKLRDHRFKTFTRARMLFTHTQSEAIFQREFRDLFWEAYPEKMLVRLVGVTLERLTKAHWQPTLWNWEQAPDE